MKKNKKKMILYCLGGIVLLVVIAVVYITNKMKSQGEESVLKKLDEANVSLSFEEIESVEGVVRFARSGNPNGKKLMLIHGSPGDWSAWINVFLHQTIRDKFDIIAIDRLGYGGTTIPASGLLEKQAQAAITVAKEKWPGEKYVVVGHSYGGAVAEEVLLNNYDQLGGVVFVAATLGPEYQAPKWYNKVGELKLINMLLPKSFQSSNKEMMPLSGELKKNESRLSGVQKPVIMIHGKKDVLVPFATVDYIKKHIKEVEYVINDTMNHFVPWSHPELITNAILSFEE